jgi:hypothetical protein
MKTKLHVNLGLMGLVFSLFFTAAVAAQDHVVVAPGNTQGWSDSSSTAGGSVDFVTDEDAPRGVGALELSTDSTTTAKANYMLLMEPVAFADLTDLSYYNKTVSASFAQGAASYQLTVCLEGYDATLRPAPASPRSFSNRIGTQPRAPSSLVNGRSGTSTKACFGQPERTPERGPAPSLPVPEGRRSIPSMH